MGGHARIIEKNLRRASIIDDLIVLNDGHSAVDYLFKENGYAGAQHPLPHVVLLDLNLPGFDGYQVLARLKVDERTQHIPVIVVSTTDDPDDIKQCHALGCHACLTKSGNYAQFIETLHQELRALLQCLVCPPPGDGI